MNFRMFKLDLEKVEEPGSKLPTICWIIEKARQFQKNVYFCFTDSAKPLIVWITTNLENSERDYLTCSLRDLYAGQEATVRIGHGKTDWFQIRKGVCQGCMLSPCLLIAEYLQNAGLDEVQAGIKIAWRNINNLRHVDDTTLMAESKEELKSFLI